MDLYLLLWKFVTFAQYGVLFLLAMLLLVYLMQDRMLYNPEFPNKSMKFSEGNPRGFRNPLERFMPFEDVYVKTKDGVKLHGWFIKQANPKEHDTIIYFHENAGNIGSRLLNIQTMYNDLSVNVIIVGYRGYGHSEGIPSEEGLELDAEAVFNYAIEHTDVNIQRLFIFGRSLGGAVAIKLVSKI